MPRRGSRPASRRAGTSGAGHRRERPATDPLLVLRAVGDLGDDELTRAVGEALRDAELAAVSSAAATPSAFDVLRAAHDAGRRVAIVSNNHGDAVDKYLRANDLIQYIEGIAGRVEGMDPREMKPQPHLVRAGLTTVRAQPAEAVFVGDSVSDVEAGQAAGVAVVGYANKPGKRERLADADTVIDTMNELADALRSPAVRS